MTGMMMRRFRLAFCMATLSLVAPAQDGNNTTVRSAPPTVIRTETRLVLVDVVVRDKKGKSVSDLGAGDFRIWEDGNERAITSLSLEGTGSPDQSESQYLVFLFDSLGVSAESRLAAEKSARQDVADFVGAYASPHRYMAVGNFNGDLRIAQNFTAMADRVQRAVGDIAHVADRVLEAYDPNSDPKPFQDLAAVGRATVPGLTLPPPSYQRLPVVEAIRVIADSMAAIRGRKSLVVLSASRPSVVTEPPDWQGAAAARACNGANIAVYATSAALRTLAEETGGRWIIPNNLIRELGEIVDDQEKRYVLGFTPVESRDGSCHSLRVHTTRSGLQVRARDAYCNAKAADLLAGKVKGKDLEARASSPSAGNAAASMELPYFYSSPGIALVDLAMEIDLGNLKFTKQNGKQHVDLDLVALAYGTDGEVAGKFSDTVPLDFATAQEVETFRRQPYHYEHQFRLPPGRYNVRVAFSSGEQTFGKVEAPLTIDTWDGQRLVLSGIALAKEAQKVPDLTSDLDPSLLEGHKDLIAKSTEISPWGSNRFSRTAPCFGYLEIYEPLLAGLHPPTISLEMRILDRRTGEQKAAGSLDAADYIRPGNPVVPVLLKVPIASVPAGSYRLEVKAVRSPGDASVFRTVEFEVEE